MSLNFDYSNVSAISQLLENYPHEVESVIWHTRFLGVNSLATDADVDKFYVRYVQHNRASCHNTPYFLSYNDVWMMKGLHTNASSMTDAAFAKQCRRHLEEDAALLLHEAKANYAS